MECSPPPKNEYEALHPAKKPTAMKAGVNSTIHDQFSTLIAAFQPMLYSVQPQCQSQSNPGAYSETQRL